MWKEFVDSFCLLILGVLFNENECKKKENSFFWIELKVIVWGILGDKKLKKIVFYENLLIYIFCLFVLYGEFRRIIFG